MLSVTGINRFYYIPGFTDMRCKHSRVLSIIREQLRREPDEGDVFIVTSKDRRIVRMFTYDNRSYSLFEKKFVSDYQFMKVTREGGEKAYGIDWRDVVLISRSPINYSEDMPSDQKDRYIRYLIEQYEEKDLELRAIKQAVEEFQSIHDGVAASLANLQKEMAEMKGELSSERSKRKAAEARVQKLEQQLKYAQKNRSTMVKPGNERDYDKAKKSNLNAELAAAYHSVISTVKLHDMSSWHYLGEFFQKIVCGCRDFLRLTPQNIGLEYAKC